MLGIFISSIISPYAMPKIIPTQRTRSAIIHAIAHCINTVNAAERTLPSSRFTVAIAATHGVYSRVNTRNTIAVNGVKSVCICETSPPSRRVRVETTLSFAVRPVIRAVEALQSPKPSGANIGANRLPSIASKLFSALSATLSLMSNVCKNHITIDAAKITVNAFWIKSVKIAEIVLFHVFIAPVKLSKIIQMA